MDVETSRVCYFKVYGYDLRKSNSVISIFASLLNRVQLFKVKNMVPEGANSFYKSGPFLEGKQIGSQ